jgi:D-alanyl-lipoteichoic acid acyltransferase DltB (MBOAT superfamily)
MLFNSFGYILIFLPCIVGLSILSRRWAWPVVTQSIILAASLVFYAWFKPSHLPYLLGSILCNAAFARCIANSVQPRKKRWLQFALVCNIAFLCTFKYVNFFLGSLLPFIHRKALLPDFDFPLGISFFTLTQLMYLVDCYGGLLEPLGLFDHATFVAFFPYVVSGPIAKAKRIAHQFPGIGSAAENDAALLVRGLYLFSLGLFKKVVFAFAFSYIADFGFALQGRLSALEAWVFTIAYTLQIYFDFSGYTDMAVGSAMMLGLEIPRNFDAPLRSKSIIEFWQRWHISLSSFITTYLYTPILRAFKTATLATAAVATMFAMTIAGLWHGPSWPFVVFGAMHGAGLVVNQYWRKKKIARLPAFVSWLLTFLLVASAFAIFRSHTLVEGGQMVRSLFSPIHPLAAQHLQDMHDAFSLKIFGLPILAGVVSAFYGPSSDQMERAFAPTYRRSVAFSLLTLTSLLFMNSNIAQQFVYFKF